MPVRGYQQPTGPGEELERLSEAVRELVRQQLPTLEDVIYLLVTDEIDLLRHPGWGPAGERVGLNLTQLKERTGAPTPGRRTHAAVIAPHRGGLTSFLADLEARAAQHAALRPVRVVCEDPRRWEQDVRQGLAALGAPAWGPLLEDVLSAAQEVWKGQGRLLLILDLGRAARQLAALPVAQGAADPLLEFLRVLVNVMEDREPPLAVVAGWGDDFRRTLQQWRRHDVDQRYDPVVPLWPNFGQEKAEDAWRCYQEVLRFHRLDAGGSFPGLMRCLDPVPVGELLDRLRAEQRQQVDGPFLLRLLLERRNTDQAVRALDADALVALCLEDNVVRDGPLRQKVEAGFRGWVEPDEGGLRATARLYAELGLAPPLALVGLREQVQFRLEQGGDADLAVEVLAGVRQQLPGPGEGAPWCRAARTRPHSLSPWRSWRSTSSRPSRRWRGRGARSRTCPSWRPWLATSRRTSSPWRAPSRR